MVIGLGMGGTLTTLSLTVQNAVPYRLVGIAMSALHFPGLSTVC